jgi:hypothetical protein
LATMKCNRDGKAWDNPDFLPTLERHLGLRQQPQPQAKPAATTPVRHQYTGGPVSAPPSREVPSYSTGRPSEPMRLTAAERADARTFGISDEAYLKGKQRLAREKAAGMHGG